MIMRPPLGQCGQGFALRSCQPPPDRDTFVPHTSIRASHRHGCFEPIGDVMFDGDWPHVVRTVTMSRLDHEPRVSSGRLYAIAPAWPTHAVRYETNKGEWAFMTYDFISFISGCDAMSTASYGNWSNMR